MNNFLFTCTIFPGLSQRTCIGQVVCYHLQDSFRREPFSLIVPTTIRLNRQIITQFQHLEAWFVTQGEQVNYYTV